MDGAQHRMPPAGWASALGELVETDGHVVIASLRSFVHDAAEAQMTAWGRSVEILQSDGRTVIAQDAATARHGTILEYLMPREGGRRPDVILLQDAAVLVVEFKNTDRVHVGDIDQVAAYARDLREYHSECHGLPVIPILLHLGKGPRLKTAGVTLTTPGDFASLVGELAKQHALSAGGQHPLGGLQRGHGVHRPLAPRDIAWPKPVREPPSQQVRRRLPPESPRLRGGPEALPKLDGRCRVKVRQLRHPPCSSHLPFDAADPTSDPPHFKRPTLVGSGMPSWMKCRVPVPRCRLVRQKAHFWAMSNPRDDVPAVASTCPFLPALNWAESNSRA